MKKLLTNSIVAALVYGLSTTTFAAETKMKKDAPAAAPAAEAKAADVKPPESPKEKKAGPLPFQGKVDTIDADGKKFTTKNKDGKMNTFNITDKTVITKDDAPAKFADLKIGEVVRGTRIKKGEGEWDAVKVMIGPKKGAPTVNGDEKKPQ